MEKGAEQINLKSFQYYDRMLPAQDMLPAGGIGNLIALPLQGKALRDGNSAFIDKNWNAYPNQWKSLWTKPRLSKEFLELKIQEWGASVSDLLPEIDEEGREKPWEKGKKFSAAEIDGKLNMTLSNGIYVDSLNLTPSIQNKIRRLAAFRNPKYYKNNVIGTSNYDTSSWIYLGKDHLSGYIEIPRGLYGSLLECISESGIAFEIADERQPGKPIHVSFKGVVEQYAGRLNRDYAGKESVIVYDYVDSHIPMFDNMYAKRLRAYKQIGYDVCSGITGKKQTANAIYDSDSCQPVFQKDLLDAQKTIVISSPAISGPKVHALISLLI